MHRRHLLALPLASALARPALAQGTPWPARSSIRLVITFPPGGLADTVYRLIAPALGETLGQTLVIDNRAGAGGTIGADLVAKSPPDGYTLIASHASPHGIAPGVYPNLPYDPVADFTHLALLCDTANALMVRPDSPLRTLPELLAAAHTRPVRFGTSGVGSITHLMGEVLARDAATPLEHVPYRGSGPALQDLLGGVIESVFDPLATYVAQIRDGSLRCLAVSTAVRVPALPAVPTFAELGLPRVTATTWVGLAGPKGLPEPIGARLTAAALTVMARPDIKARLDDLGTYAPAPPVTGPACAAYVADFVRQWTAVARAANITAA